MLDDPFGDKAELVGLKRAPRALRWLASAAVVVLLVLLLVVLTSGEVRSEEVPLHVCDLEGKGATVKLMSGPCVDPVSKILTTALPTLKWRAIDSRWLMKDGTRSTFPGCWAALGRSFLFVYSDQTGDDVKRADCRLKGQVTA